MSKAQRVTCIVLALAAIGLPFLMSPLKAAKQKRRFDEIMHSDTIQKMVKEAQEKQADR